MSRKAGLLSGGEQQMLAMGRALATEPAPADGRRDEPRPGADHRRAAAARAAPHRRRDRGVGCCSSSSTCNLALEVADRAYVLSHGDLVLEGDTAHLRANRHLLESSYLGEQALEPTGTEGA